MKIKAIRINGFRGITPFEYEKAPAVNLELFDPKDENLENLLIFGPNAFGKSSIADAIEWFFKGKSRGAAYFDEYSDSDNVHLYLGKSGYASEGFVELDVVQNGEEYTIRRTFDATGKVIKEELAGLENELRKVQDEIIVLDHDQFRRFITEAHIDKWETFSSLIGYEVLDHFRSGLTSLTSRSLTDRLGTKQLKRQIKEREDRWRADLESLQQVIGVDFSQDLRIENLVKHLKNEVEVISISLGLTPSREMGKEFWDLLTTKSQPSEVTLERRKRTEVLNSMIAALAPLPNTFCSNLEDLRSIVISLTSKKRSFDKEILARFYQQGLKTIREQKAEPDRCPFCKSPYDWEFLVPEVKGYLNDLDFEGIQSDFRDLNTKWQMLKPTILEKARRLKGIEITEINEILDSTVSTSIISQKLRIESFDGEPVLNWIDSWLKLSEVIDRNRRIAKEKQDRLMQVFSETEEGKAYNEIPKLKDRWDRLQKLIADRGEISTLKTQLMVTEQVIRAIRGSTKAFREELQDFSARVVEEINEDIKSYYYELHAYDDIRPFLDIVVSGNSRQVFLRCDYKGFHNMDAASMLSESHRNSLGLAIMLAFRIYKQRLGSPLNFIVFDDVTQSFDTTHRTSLLDLLENPAYPEISNQQILFLTHDRTLAYVINRFGENRGSSNWRRKDIRNWWLEGILLAPPVEDPRKQAEKYLNEGDEIAAAIYLRKSLEELYKEIISSCKIKVRYNPKPWTYKMPDYHRFIKNEIEYLHDSGEGFIDPEDEEFARLFTTRRILNLTVHDSDFLEDDMTLHDVQESLRAIEDLDKMFSCEHCGARLTKLKLKNNGETPQCNECHRPVRYAPYH